MYKRIDQCRICGCRKMDAILDIGEQELTGVFPTSKDLAITKGPLIIVLCRDCNLVQLMHSYDLKELYGDNYGYRSGLNASMVAHLGAKVEALSTLRPLQDKDIVVDIGSNDGTTLAFYPYRRYQLVGFDPTGTKFRKYYRDDIDLVTDFFSAQRFFDRFGTRKRAKIVTSIAMFYDLEDPTAFMQQVARILDKDGVWHFEQSYMPEMLRMTAYDTICHEHLEYYGLKQIKWMTDRTGLKIIDVAFNDVNGGSFAITAAKQESPYKEASDSIGRVLSSEETLGLHTLAPYEEFRQHVFWHRETLLDILFDIKRHGHLVHGYGASTKGNVILQFCNIGPDMLDCIAEVNETKFGCITPGTHIPIVSETQSKKHHPDYYLVLPWHFRANLLVRESTFIDNGGQMVFPLPRVETVGK